MVLRNSNIRARHGASSKWGAVWRGRGRCGDDDKLKPSGKTQARAAFARSYTTQAKTPVSSRKLIVNLARHHVAVSYKSEMQI